MAPNSPRQSNPIAFLIRHGLDTLSDSGVFVSWTDVDLNEEGVKQASVVYDFLSDYDIQQVYSSPLIRCVTMALMLGKPIQQERSLLPWNRGVLTGTLEEEGKDTLKLYMQNPKVKIPLGESRLDCENRLEKFFIRALADAEEKMAAFFTHHSVIDVLNSLLKGERNDEPENLVKPGGVVAVFVDGDGYRLEPVLNVDEKSSVSMS
jgi:broad specificity phosphatase PhoE